MPEEVRVKFCDSSVCNKGSTVLRALVISSSTMVCTNCEDRTSMLTQCNTDLLHYQHMVSLYVLLTLSGCTARQALLYAFLTSDGVTSWCISHLFHFASSHTTVCIEHKRALMLCVLPSIQSRICRDRKNIILYRFMNVSDVATIQLKSINDTIQTKL